MIDIGHPCVRVHLPGHLVHRVSGREARPYVNELADALAGEPAGDAGEVGAVVAGGLPGPGDGAQEPLGGLLVGLVVLLSAEQPVVNPGGVRGGLVDAQGRQAGRADHGASSTRHEKTAASRGGRVLGNGSGAGPGHGGMTIISVLAWSRGFAGCWQGSKSCVTITGTGGDTLGDEIIPASDEDAAGMKGNELPPWAVRLRQERTRRLWSQKATAIRLRDAADTQTRGSLPDVESIQRYVRAYEAGRHIPGDLYAELYCRAFGLTREALFGPSSAQRPGGPPGEG